MRSLTLQALTWGTVTAAVGSALWLAAGESGRAEVRKGLPMTNALVLPQEPTSAGRATPVVAERQAITGRLPAAELPLTSGR